MKTQMGDFNNILSATGRQAASARVGNPQAVDLPARVGEGDSKGGSIPFDDDNNEYDEDDAWDFEAAPTEKRICGLNPFLWYLIFVVISWASVIGGVQWWATWMWPRDDMYLRPHPAKEEKLEVLYQRIAERNVPPLRDFTPDWSKMGQEAPAPYDLTSTSRDCITPFWNGLHDRLSRKSGGTNRTQPEKAREVLNLMGLENSSLARTSVGDLLFDPVDYAGILNESRGCALSNFPLNMFACEALDYLDGVVSTSTHDGDGRVPIISGKNAILGSNTDLFLDELWVEPRAREARYGHERRADHACRTQVGHCTQRPREYGPHSRRQQDLGA